jgi:hypothetical protein
MKQSSIKSQDVFINEHFDFLGTKQREVFQNLFLCTEQLCDALYRDPDRDVRLGYQLLLKECDAAMREAYGELSK